MDFVAALKEKAKKAGKTIVLCEGEDKRVVEAERDFKVRIKG